MIQALGGVEGILEHTLFRGSFIIRCYALPVRATSSRIVFRDVLSNLGRSFLGESERIRRVDEVQEVDKCSAIRSQPDSKQKIYVMVVANDQPC